MSTKTVRIDTDGSIRFIWDDKLKPLFDLGKGKISRASHVEPTVEGRWSTDLAPVLGPTLGPFGTRAEALNAEVEWLQENIIGL